MEINAGKAQTAVIVVVGVLVVVGVVIFGKKIMETFNIIDTKDERRDEKAIANAEKASYLKPNYRNPKDKKMSDATAKTLAKEIYNSVGVFSDDPERMLAVFKLLNNKTQVSQLVDTFALVYQKDLFGWLKIKMDTEAQKDAYAQALRIIAGLK